MLLEPNDQRVNPNFLMLQLSSSAFPSGSYTHSSGFEAFIEFESISDASSLQHYLSIWLLQSVARCDGPAVALTHRYIGDNRSDLLVELSDTLSAIKYSKSNFDSSVMMGKATLNSLLQSLSGVDQSLASFMGREPQRELELHHAVVWGIATKLYDVNVEDAVSAYLFSSFSGVLEVLARIVPLGQKNTQKILVESHTDLLKALDTSLEMDLEQLGSQTAIHDIAAMNHDRLLTRLCIT